MPLTVSPASANVCVSAQQATVIQGALDRFERLKPAYVAQSAAYRSLLVSHGQDSLLLASNGHLITWYKNAYTQEQGLRQDLNGKLTTCQHKAARRGFMNVVEAAALVFLGYVLITK